jgi:hypothetical protein
VSFSVSINISEIHGVCDLEFRTSDLECHRYTGLPDFPSDSPVGVLQSGIQSLLFISTNQLNSFQH